MFESKLRPKQEAFAQAYLQCGNASAAYRQAYDANNMSDHAVRTEASKLLEHPVITLRIASLRGELSDKSVVDANYVLNGFVEVYERSMQHKPALGRDGKPTGEYVFNTSGANRSLEMIGKVLGIFVDRSESKQMSGTPQEYAEIQALKEKYAAMSVEELMALRESRRALLAGNGAVVEGEGKVVEHVQG